MGTTQGGTLGTTLERTAGRTQHTARSLVDLSLATNPAPGLSTGLTPELARAERKALRYRRRHVPASLTTGGSGFTASATG
jgi:hypothetical protein